VDLAADKLLPWQFLFNLGVEDEYLWHGSRVIKIPYYSAAGEEHSKVRVRTELSGNKGSRWDEDTPGDMIPYGLNKLDLARKQYYLLIGEGESDGWSCWWHDVPYLGVPGATNEKCLHAKMLADIPRVYIIQEPDKAGQGFYKRVHERLRTTGYKGEIYALPWKKLTGCKDPNALHKHLKGQGFKEKVLEALKAAITSGDEIDRHRRKKIEYYRLHNLQDETFPELRWAIPDILPEGLTWLRGKPKLGKSWMLLSMMCSIALGGVALGNVPVEQGEVLYLSLEDNKRRLKDRANKVLNNLKMSPNFYYRTDYPRLNDGGLEALEEFLQEHPNTRLIGIDTWAKIKPKASNSQQKQQYDEDYESLTPLQELAGKYNVSIVLVHHMRKQESDDPLDAVAGSVALQGAVDGFLLLYRKRGEDDARLFITGRDIEQEQEMVVTFNHDNATWTVKGSSDEFAGTPERQQILDVLKHAPDGLAAREIASRLSKNLYTTRNLLVSLRKEDKILLKNNVYSLVRHSEHSYTSYPSEHSEEDVKKPGESEEPHYDLTMKEPDRSEAIVRLVSPVDEPVEPVDEDEESSLTRITRITSDDPILITLRDLYHLVQEHVAEKSKNPKWPGKLFWYGEGTGFPNESVGLEEYARRVQVCRKSMNRQRIVGAANAMRRTLAIEEE
jgi:hypothetical protein